MARSGMLDARTRPTSAALRGSCSAATARAVPDGAARPFARTAAGACGEACRASRVTALGHGRSPRTRVPGLRRRRSIRIPDLPLPL
jgi:hypothetical protein